MQVLYWPCGSQGDPGHTSPLVTGADHMPSAYKQPELGSMESFTPKSLKQSSQQGRETNRAVPNFADKPVPPTREGGQA